VRFLSQVLEGLAFLHSRGIAHRDIKAANLLLDKHGRVKLADFGVAKQIQQASEAAGDSAKGSPYWMAPEVISLGHVTTKCDIWSLGCTTVELLTGKTPYSALLPYPAMIRIVEDEHPPMPAVSSQARSFLKACFCKDQDRRPSAEQLLAHPWLAAHSAPLSSTARQLLRQLLEDSDRDSALEQLLEIGSQGGLSQLYREPDFYPAAWRCLKDKKYPKRHLAVELVGAALTEASIPTLWSSELLPFSLQFTHSCHPRALVSAGAHLLAEVAQLSPASALGLLPLQPVANLLALDYPAMKEEALLGLEALERLVRQAGWHPAPLRALLHQHQVPNLLALLLQALLADPREALGKFADKALFVLAWAEAGFRGERGKRLALIRSMAGRLASNKNITGSFAQLLEQYGEDHELQLLLAAQAWRSERAQ
jgi:hypothetical protein